MKEIFIKTSKGMFDNMPSSVFGQMMDLACDTVIMYRSDFYHDVHQLDYLIRKCKLSTDGNFCFYFAFGERGTALSDKLDYFVTTRGRVFKFEFNDSDRNIWDYELTITELVL